MNTSEFPLTLTVDYPETANRLTSFFRVIVAIPIWIIASLLGNALWIPVMLMLVFRQKYPRWWFDWNLALMRFSARVSAYTLLLLHEYPSTDEEQSVHISLEYPDATRDLNRWLPLVKWFLAIPHIVVFVVLLLGAFLAAIGTWLAVLVTGRVPEGLFNYTVGVMRYGLRLEAYGFILVTDQYPPFSLR